MWPDKAAVATVCRLRDMFGVRTLVETGTAHGIGARLWAQHFRIVVSCDIDAKMVAAARARTKDLLNVFIIQQDSPVFLREFRERHDTRRHVIIVLDAHWYAKWPLLEELRALHAFPYCCIVIHDFKVPGMGFVSYNGQDLDLDYVRDALMSVNPNFHLYTNYPEACDIVTKDEVAQGKVPGLELDPETEWVLDYAWSEESKRLRGILYAVPVALDESFRVKEVILEPRP
jgi:SAM-dependent methyltransferase